MTKFTYMLAGASLLAIVGNVSAAEPMTLSSIQMDGISAGSAAVAVTCGCVCDGQCVNVTNNPSPTSNIPGFPTPSVPLIRFIPILPTNVGNL